MKFVVSNKPKRNIYHGDHAMEPTAGAPRKRGKKGMWIAIVIAAVLILGAAWGGALVAHEIGGGGAKAQGMVDITVPDGASTGDVAAVLKENGLIGNETVFKTYSKLTGADGTYQQGQHQILGGSGYAEIVEELKKITYYVPETVRVTFPEGTTALKMAMILKDNGLISSWEEFIDACNNDTFDVSFFDQISDNKLKFIKLEGFLYPDTYEFEVGSDAHDMILVMLRNFEKKVLTDQFRADLANSKYSLEEIVILASLVQKESFNGEERNVSSVFNNRLNNTRATNGLLQSDTTGRTDWRWLGGYIGGVLDYYYGGKENVPAGMAEAYDSYHRPGLMVGAICNPDATMIDATLHPNETPYYYFFTDIDGKFYYSKTHQEHEYQWAHTKH